MVEGPRKLLRSWLLEQLDEGNFPGVEWYGADRTLFKIPWLHKSKSGWTTEHVAIFKAWSQHTGYYKETDTDTDLKSRFRSALNKAHDIRYCPELSSSEDTSCFRVYRFLAKGEAQTVKKERFGERSSLGSISSDSSNMSVVLGSPLEVTRTMATSRCPLQLDIHAAGSSQSIAAHQVSSPDANAAASVCAAYVRHSPEFRTVDTSALSPTRPCSISTGCTVTPSTGVLTCYPYKYAASGTVATCGVTSTSHIDPNVTYIPPTEQEPSGVTHTATTVYTSTISQAAMCSYSEIRPSTYNPGRSLFAPNLPLQHVTLPSTVPTNISVHHIPNTVADASRQIVPGVYMASITPRHCIANLTQSAPIPLSIDWPMADATPGYSAQQEQSLSMISHEITSAPHAVGYLEVELFYNSSLVAKCPYRSHCNVLLPNEQQHMGHGKKNTLLLPTPDVQSGSRESRKDVHTLLESMAGGLQLEYEDGNIYATRHCLVHVFFSNFFKPLLSTKIIRRERTAIFLMSDFEAALRDVDHGGKPPSSEVYLGLGRRCFYGTDAMASAPIVLKVQSMKAHELVQNTLMDMVTEDTSSLQISKPE